MSVTRREFEELVRQHLPGALRLATRLTRSPDLAEEIVQNSMLRASKGWRSYRGDASFQTWMHRIVVNVYRDQASASNRHEHFTLCPDEMSPLEEPSRQAESNELSELIDLLIDQLPRRQRDVIVLSSYHNHTTAEIASIMESSESNVYATLHVARQKLRQALQPYFAEN